MSVQNKDIVYVGSAVMPEDETTVQIGGAADMDRKVCFHNLEINGGLEVVSSHASEDMDVTITGFLSSGDDSEDTKSLNGQTPVAFTGTWYGLKKAVKASGNADGDIAVMAVTNERANTAQGGGDDYITLDAGASSTDDEYLSMVIRTTGGTGANQIRECIQYTGSDKKLYVNRDWGTNPDATTTFEIAVGIVFDNDLSSGGLEFLEVFSIFQNVAAEPPGGSDVVIYEKVFGYNKNALTLTNAKIAEVAEGAASMIAFDLEDQLDGSDDNESGNARDVAPSGSWYSFDSAQKDVPNSGNWTGESAIGLWLELTLPAGTAGSRTFWKPRVTGFSIGS